MICNYCAYEHSDCKGSKGDPNCTYFKKPNVFNAHEAAHRIADLESHIEDLEGSRRKEKMNLIGAIITGMIIGAAGMLILIVLFSE